MLLNNSFSSSAILMRSPEMFGRQHSRYHIFTKVAHVQHFRKNTVTTSYRNTTQRCHLVHRFPSVTSHNTSHTFNIASFIGVEGEHYGYRRQHSRVQHASVYAIHTPEIFYCPLTTPLLQRG
jgi:hypothetical protein